MRPIERILTTALASFQRVTAKIPRNSWFCTYSLQKESAPTPYLTRTLFPRFLGHRLMLHHIHQPDRDEHPHDHPWETAYGFILNGGYGEVRQDVATSPQAHVYFEGDINRLETGIFHRIVHVLPNTWTLFLAGKPTDDWGFLVDGEKIAHEPYIRAHP